MAGKNGANGHSRDIGGTLDALLLALTRHDPSTGAHSARVADYTAAVAGALGMTQERIREVRHAALVHDVGKLSVPERILRKNGTLSTEEIRLIRLHPIMGARIVSCLPTGVPLAKFVLRHHERWDGAGYPAGLKAQDIPLESRLIFVADAFDAMTTARPYGGIFSPEDALAEIDACSGRQFDPRAVEAIHAAHTAGSLLPHPASALASSS